MTLGQDVLNTPKHNTNYVNFRKTEFQSMSVHARSIYYVLRASADYNKDVSQVKLSMQKICELSGVGRTKAFKCINELVRIGILQRKKGRSCYDCNTYLIAKELGYFNRIATEIPAANEENSLDEEALNDDFLDDVDLEEEGDSDFFAFPRSSRRVLQSFTPRTTVVRETNDCRTRGEYNSLISSLISSLDYSLTLLDEKKGLTDKVLDDGFIFDFEKSEKMINTHRSEDEMKSVKEKDLFQIIPGSDYYNNHESEDELEGQVNDCKMNPVKSDYFEKQTNFKQSDTLSSKKSLNSTKSSHKKHSNYKQDKRFMLFYEAYPRKAKPRDAYKAFHQINPDDNELASIIENIEQRKKHPNVWNDPQYIPYPATYLRSGDYESELPASMTCRAYIPVSSTDNNSQLNYDSEDWANDLYVDDYSEIFQ